MTVKDRETILQVLASMSPHCFDRASPKPLSIGIKERIQEELPKLGGNNSKRFLRWWCTRDAYLKAVAAADSVRHDWDGEPCGEVDPEHRRFARGVIRTREKRQAVAK